MSVRDIPARPALRSRTVMACIQVLTGEGRPERTAGSSAGLIAAAGGFMPFCMIDPTCSRVFLRRPYGFSSGRRGSPCGCDSSDAHEFAGIDDPAVRGDQTICDLDRVDGVDPAFPVEHEGELAADLGE